MNVLVGVDDSPYSEAAIRHVTEGVWPKGTRFIVLSAVEPIFVRPGQTSGGDAIAKLQEEQEKYHKEIAQSAADRLREKGLTADPRVVVADARAALMDTARSEHAHLIVVGSHGRTGVKKLLLGSVASHVVAHAPCSVLVVRGEGSQHA